MKPLVAAPSISRPICAGLASKSALSMKPAPTGSFQKGEFPLTGAGRGQTEALSAINAMSD
jgi:hypothetical protein